MTFTTPELLLVGAVAAVGVLHTIVPDHWVPITLIARQRGWSKTETARASLVAGTGHVLSTLLIAVVVWVAGVAAAKRFGGWVDTITSLALIGFGGWIAISALLEMRRGGGHGHAHGHGRAHSHGGPTGEGVHGPERRRIETHDGPVNLSIYETGMAPHFRLSGGHFDAAIAVTSRPDRSTQTFAFVSRGDFWQSTDEIPEPHGFEVTLSLRHGDHEHAFTTAFAERDHDHHDPAKAKAGSRTALLLILGSSPMVEGIPAFFAAGKYGIGLIVLMSLVFGLATIATYVVLCVGSVAGLQRVRLGPFERYGEVLSGAFIALVGVVFWLWPVL
jgi:ABC-type nickel/cobalt efflux system permease component RcnA